MLGQMLEKGEKSQEDIDFPDTTIGKLCGEVNVHLKGK